MTAFVARLFLEAGSSSNLVWCNTAVLHVSDSRNDLSVHRRHHTPAPICTVYMMPCVSVAVARHKAPSTELRSLQVV